LPTGRVYSFPQRLCGIASPATGARPKNGSIWEEPPAMCHVFASQDPAIYQTITRSVRLNGFSTSIRLEALFWSILDQIAKSQGMSTGRFISTLHDEVLELRGEVGNFTSLLRVTCAVFIEKNKDMSLVQFAQDDLREEMKVA
jgi:predicted DNA-binding ribbon-helix-helix protein